MEAVMSPFSTLAGHGLAMGWLWAGTGIHDIIVSHVLITHAFLLGLFVHRLTQMYGFWLRDTRVKHFYLGMTINKV